MAAMHTHRLLTRFPRLFPPGTPRDTQEDLSRQDWCRSGKAGLFWLTEAQQAQGLF